MRGVARQHTKYGRRSQRDQTHPIRLKHRATGHSTAKCSASSVAPEHRLHLDSSTPTIKSRPLSLMLCCSSKRDFTVLSFHICKGGGSTRPVCDGLHLQLTSTSCTAIRERYSHYMSGKKVGTEIVPIRRSLTRSDNCTYIQGCT